MFGARCAQHGEDRLFHHVLFTHLELVGDGPSCGLGLFCPAELGDDFGINVFDALLIGVDASLKRGAFVEKRGNM